jgi:hypothetical protein
VPVLYLCAKLLLSHETGNRGCRASATGSDSALVEL